MSRPRSYFRLADYEVGEGPGSEQLQLICSEHGQVATFEVPTPLTTVMDRARTHHNTVHTTTAARYGRAAPKE